MYKCFIQYIVGVNLSFAGDGGIVFAGGTMICLQAVRCEFGQVAPRHPILAHWESTSRRLSFLQLNRMLLQHTTVPSDDTVTSSSLLNTLLSSSSSSFLYHNGRPPQHHRDFPQVHSRTRASCRCCTYVRLWKSTLYVIPDRDDIAVAVHQLWQSLSLIIVAS